MNQIKLNELSNANMHAILGGEGSDTPPYLSCGCSCACDNCQQNKGSINKSTRKNSRRDTVHYPQV